MQCNITIVLFFISYLHFCINTIIIKLIFSISILIKYFIIVCFSFYFSFSKNEIMLKLIIWEIACILLNLKKHIYQKNCYLIFFIPFSEFFRRFGTVQMHVWIMFSWLKPTWHSYSFFLPFLAPAPFWHADIWHFSVLFLAKRSWHSGHSKGFSPSTHTWINEKLITDYIS